MMKPPTTSLTAILSATAVPQRMMSMTKTLSLALRNSCLMTSRTRHTIRCIISRARSSTTLETVKRRELLADLILSVVVAVVVEAAVVAVEIVVVVEAVEAAVAVVAVVATMVPKMTSVTPVNSFLGRSLAGAVAADLEVAHAVGNLEGPLRAPAAATSLSQDSFPRVHCTIY